MPGCWSVQRRACFFGRGGLVRPRHSAGGHGECLPRARGFASPLTSRGTGGAPRRGRTGGMLRAGRQSCEFALLLCGPRGEKGGAGRQPSLSSHAAAQLWVFRGCRHGAASLHPLFPPAHNYAVPVQTPACSRPFRFTITCHVQTMHILAGPLSQHNLNWSVVRSDPGYPQGSVAWSGEV